MKHAYVFPGQGSQSPVWDLNITRIALSLKNYLNRQMRFWVFVSQILCFAVVMKTLKQTKVTQPAVFLHSIIAYRSIENAEANIIR